MLGCLTGLRFSDYSKITADEIKDDMLYIHQTKTLSQVIIPLRKEAKEILIEKYQLKIPQVLNFIAKGDEKAFRQLVDLFWQRVYVNTLSLVKTPAKAQEITQDIFYKVWLKRVMLADVKNFMHFVYVVGKNQVISEMRKKLMEQVVI